MPMSYHTTKHKRKRNSLIVRKELKAVQHNGRVYKLLDVETKDGLSYLCLRLYNANNHFIKQFLFEREVAIELGLLSKGGGAS
jgi:hypothetical protein